MKSEIWVLSIFLVELFYKHTDTNIIVINYIDFTPSVGLQVVVYLPCRLHHIYILPYNKWEIFLLTLYNMSHLLGIHVMYFILLGQCVLTFMYLFMIYIINTLYHTS